MIGILLDQQVHAEMAFGGPYKIKERLGHLDMDRIAEMDEDDLDTIEKRAGDLPGFGPKKAGAMGPALELFGHRHVGAAS